MLYEIYFIKHYSFRFIHVNMSSLTALLRKSLLLITDDSIWKNLVDSSARSNPKKVGQLVNLGEFGTFA